MYVRDQDEALRFYTEQLGFEKRADVMIGSARFLAVAPPGAETALALSAVDTHGGELADRFAAEIGFSPHFMLVTDDLAATCAALAARGVTVAGPEGGPGEPRRAQLTDLYGNVITLVDADSARRLIGR
jgi:predicted enzyme related to lactoylglutathione lyase